MKKLRYILYAYLVGILVFTLFRLVETWAYCASATPTPDLEGLYWKALLMGLRFDTAVSGYLLLIPLVMIIVGMWIPIRNRYYYTVAHYFTLTLYTVAFFACAADIPYFLNFFTRLNAVSLAWMDSPSIVLGMIVSEPRYLVFLLAFIAVAVGYWLWMRRFWRRLLKPASERPRVVSGVLLTLLLVAGCLVGMRGRLSKKAPIRVGTAYFCNNAFLNQIGLNPVFTFIKSVEEMNKRSNRTLQLMDAAEAHAVAWSERSEALDDSSAVRLPDGTNVVVVIMESMACSKVGFFNPGRPSLTPCFDSILSCSLVYDSAYSAGIHTYNGVFSTLYGQPALLSQHTMKRTMMPSYCGLPQQLCAAGYQTFFHLTHDEGFDNMGGFLRANGIEVLRSQSDYPSSEVVGTWGVPDHVMLHHAITSLDNRDTSRPFLAVVLTCSDHTPYIYPPYHIALRPRSSELKDRMVEYADWSIGQFMAEARTRPWFANTLFVFIADHGAATDTRYDMSLSYNHVPLAFYCPAFIAPERRHDMALQIDLASTTLGMLMPCHDIDTNNMGVDLQRQRRPYAYFSADDKIGVVDGEWFYLYRTGEKTESLYRYMENDRHDYMPEDSLRAERMRRYAFAMLQEAQQMLLEGRTGCSGHE